jgi:hypothetical protein
MNEKEIYSILLWHQLVNIVQLTQTYSYFKVTYPSPQEDHSPHPQLIVDQVTRLPSNPEKAKAKSTKHDLSSLHRNTVCYKMQVIRDELRCGKQPEKFEYPKLTLT